MKSIAFLAATLLTAADAFHFQPSRVLHPRATKAKEKGNQEPSGPPMLGSVVVQGCFNSPGELVFNSTQTFNAKGSCGMDICNKILGKPVAATSGGNQCFCGDTYPPVISRVDDEKCNVGCTGYDIDACGGVKFWTVYNTGLTLDVDTAGGDDAKASGTGTGSKPTQTAIDPPKQTIIIKPETPEEEKPKTNTAGIAAGVVVAVVVLAAAGVGGWIYMRKKKNREIEEEHRRNAAVNSFMGKGASSSNTSITDARLDPVMAQRRMSDGSIADNQDYSRRILRVTNA
ncbi:putative wsc domain containing protein [Naviculisporaceae sp. PSN 640]